MQVIKLYTDTVVFLHYKKNQMIKKQQKSACKNNLVQDAVMLKMFSIYPFLRWNRDKAAALTDGRRGKTEGNVTAL